MDVNYLKNELSDQELMLVNSEVEGHSKTPVAAYLLWWFTGFMGGHRYYFGKSGSAIAMTLIFWLGVWIFGLGAIITGIWMFVDLFLINGWLKEDKDNQEKKAINEIMLRRQVRNNSSTADKQFNRNNDVHSTDNFDDVTNNNTEDSSIQS